MKIQAYNTNKLATNAYVIENNGECILIDPCVEYNYIFEMSDKKLVGVFITHGHFDHINDLSTYLGKGLKFYMHKNAFSKLKDPNQNCSILANIPMSFDLNDEEVIFVEDDQILDLIDKTIKIIYTPGHTDCSIMIVIDNHIFSGDMLFRGSVGRYDLYSSSYQSIQNSIQKIKNLSENYFVHPGHGMKTTLETEKRTNQFFR